MSDIQKNLGIERFRIEVQIAEMQLSIKRMDLRVLQIEEEKKQIAENRVASLGQIEKLQKELGGINNG